MIAVISSLGVTSNAGLAILTPLGATWRSKTCDTSRPGRSSIGICSPRVQAMSTVDNGAAT